MLNKIFTVGALVVISGCKPQGVDQGSSLASLDSLASTDFIYNQCTAPNATALSKHSENVQADNDYKSEVLKALSSVPAPVRDAFFQSPINGKVVVTKEIASACGSLSSSLLSCFRPGKDGNLAIFLKESSSKKETVRNIHHSTLRAFGFVLAEVIAPSIGAERFFLR